MSWFFIAIIAPLFYSVTNHIDKVLLEKHFKESGVGTLILFSSLLTAFALPVLVFIDPTVLDVSLLNAVILTIVGLMNMLVLWFYLLALRDDEASIVIVFYQLVPLIGLVLGYFILGEVLTQTELIAMAIIIIGTTVIAFEIDDDNNFKLRKRTIWLMTTASFFWALESVIFKMVALEENLWRSLFWEHVAMTVVGITVLLVVNSYREHFFKALKTNSQAIISLNFANEGLYMIGNWVSSYAYLLAPIALILLTESFQPIFVFAIGIFLTVFFPQITAEKILLRDMMQKLAAILITGFGTWLLLAG
jgi:drug/metabolite transporter (DMT)-like permease